MTDDDWLDQQQRLHNHRSFAIELPPLRSVRARRHPFTLEQLLVAERWAQQKAETQ